MGVGKSLKFLWNFDWKKGGLEAPGHRFYCCFTVLFEDSLFFEKAENSWKSMPKWTLKVTPKSTFGYSGVRFFRFWDAFWGVGFLKVFWSAKSRPKVWKFAAWGGHGAKTRRFWEGSAGRAAAVGGFWSLTGTGKSLTRVPNALLPARGAADLKANASCRRPPRYKEISKMPKIQILQI